MKINTLQRDNTNENENKNKKLNISEDNNILLNIMKGKKNKNTSCEFTSISDD